MPQTVEELIATYRSTAIAWDAMQNDSSKANPLFKTLHAIYKQLRENQAGRDAITAMMKDANPGVRVSAASHSLAWAAGPAMAALEEMEKTGPGLYRVTAKYTLKAFREGKLNLDW